MQIEQTLPSCRVLGTLWEDEAEERAMRDASRRSPWSVWAYRLDTGCSGAGWELILQRELFVPDGHTLEAVLQSKYGMVRIRSQNPGHLASLGERTGRVVVFSADMATRTVANPPKWLVCRKPL